MMTPIGWREFPTIFRSAVVDPGFPVGGHGPRGGHGLPRQLHFEIFLCQTKESGPLRGVHWALTLDPPMNRSM